MNGELKWKREDLGQMQTLNRSARGALHAGRNMLLVPWDMSVDRRLYALDKLTGKNIWKVDRDEPTVGARRS